MSAPEPSTTPSSLAERYRVLLEIGHKLSGTLAEQELYEAIYRETMRAIPSDGFYVALYDAESDEATIVFWADQGKGQEDRITYRGSESEVIRTGKGCVVADRLVDRSLMVIGDGPDDGSTTRSAVSAPIMAGDQVLGVLSAQSYAPNVYEPSDLELLQGIADLAAIATANARHVAELTRRRREAEMMEEISRGITGSLDTQAVLDRVAQAAVEVLETDGSSVWLLEEETALIAASAGPIAPDPGLRVPLEGELIRRLVQEHATVVVNDVVATPLIPSRIKEVIAAASALVVPLLGAERLVGALSVGSATSRTFRKDDAQLLQRLAGHAVVAIENARLHARLQALSLTDPLTGLPNRRHLEMHLNREFAAAQRGRQLSVVLFDLDNFKQYNDALGHLAGDEALRSLAEVLAGETRAMNLVARYGGDEFIAVLSDTPEEGARLHAGRVAEKVARHPELGPHGITVSCGVASFASDITSVMDLVRAADEDMYRSKHQNRSSPR